MGGGRRGYAGKAVNIKRMINNPNLGIFIFSFFVFVRWGGAGFGRARGGDDKGAEAIIFMCDPLNEPNTHCFSFS